MLTVLVCMSDILFITSPVFRLFHKMLKLQILLQFIWVYFNLLIFFLHRFSRPYEIHCRLEAVKHLAEPNQTKPNQTRPETTRPNQTETAITGVLVAKRTVNVRSSALTRPGPQTPGTEIHSMSFFKQIPECIFLFLYEVWNLFLLQQHSDFVRWVCFCYFDFQGIFVWLRWTVECPANFLTCTWWREYYWTAGRLLWCSKR